MLWISNTYTSAHDQMDLKHSRALTAQSSQSKDKDNPWNASVQYALLQARHNNTVPSAHGGSIAPTTAQPTLNAERKPLSLQEDRQKKKTTPIGKLARAKLYGRFALLDDKIFNLIRKFAPEIGYVHNIDPKTQIFYITPDGTRIVLAEELRLDDWNVFNINGGKIATVRFGNETPNHVYVKDGLLELNGQNDITAYSLKTGNIVSQRKKHKDALSEDEDGNFKIIRGSVLYPKRCRIYSEKDKKELFSVDYSNGNYFSPDSAWLVSHMSDHSTEVHSLKDPAIFYVFQGKVRAFSSSCKFIIVDDVYSPTEAATVYSLKDGKKIACLGSRHNAQFSADEKWVCYFQRELSDLPVKAFFIVKSLIDNREYKIESDFVSRGFGIANNLLINILNHNIHMFSLNDGQEIVKLPGSEYALSPSNELLLAQQIDIFNVNQDDQLRVELYDMAQMRSMLKLKGYRVKKLSDRYLILINRADDSVHIYDLLFMYCSHDQWMLLHILDKAHIEHQNSVAKNRENNPSSLCPEERISLKDLAHRHGVQVRNLLAIFNTFSPVHQDLLIKEYDITDAVQLMELARQKWPQEFAQQVIEPIEQRIIRTANAQKQEAAKKVMQDQQHTAIQKTEMQNENAQAHQSRLHDAISYGQMEILEDGQKKKIEDYISIHTINSRDKNFETPLLRAIFLANNSSKAHKEIIVKLLAFNEIRIVNHIHSHNQRVAVKLDDVDVYGNTALHRAIRLRLFDVALQLIDKMCAEKMLSKVLTMKCKAVEGKSVVKQKAQTPFELAQTIELDANGDKKSFDELMARMKTLQEGIRNIEKDLSNVRMQRHFRRFQDQYKTIIHAFDLHDSEKIKTIVERLLHKTTYVTLDLSQDLAFYKIHMQDKLKKLVKSNLK